MEMTIEYDNKKFLAGYDYQPEQKQDLETEPLPENVDLESLELHGEDIYDMISEESATKIEKLILKEINNLEI